MRAVAARATTRTTRAVAAGAIAAGAIAARSTRCRSVATTIGGVAAAGEHSQQRGQDDDTDDRTQRSLHNQFPFIVEKRQVVPQPDTEFLPTVNRRVSEGNLVSE